jgi:radical SAM superfamily enzyme YgiQ (UPF0313 family)
LAKVLLVNPNRMQPPVAPIALDYLASAIADRGFEVDVLDLCFSEDTDSGIERYFADNSVSAIAFTIRNTDDACLNTSGFFIPEYKGVIDRLRSHTAAPIVLGGSGFSIMPEAILEYCGLDLGIWGEGEYSLPVLASRIADGEDCRDVPGLVYRAGNGFVRSPPEYVDLASEHTPQRRVVDNHRYFTAGAMGNIETKRGCSQGCIYCADPLGKGKKVRCRSPESVAEEVEALLDMGVDCLHLCDSEFNLPPDHAGSVCAELINRGLGSKVKWYTYCSPAPFTDAMAAVFKQAGCAGINFGVDSASDSMLSILGRDYTPEDVGRTAEICHRHDIVFMYDLLLGGPGETRDTLRETVEAMKRISPSRIGVSLGVRVYPGTRLSALVSGQGPVETNPNLHGDRGGSFFAPVFYLDSALGEGVDNYLAELIGGDERFFFMAAAEAGRNYNYNDNTLLVNAIKDGCRGAFWDILRRLAG